MEWHLDRSDCDAAQKFTQQLLGRAKSCLLGMVSFLSVVAAARDCWWITTSCVGMLIMDKGRRYR